MAKKDRRMYHAYKLTCGTKIGQYEYLDRSGWVMRGGLTRMSGISPVVWRDKVNELHGEQNVRIEFTL